MSVYWPFGARHGQMRSRLIFALDVDSRAGSDRARRRCCAARSACSRSASSSSCTPGRRSCAMITRARRRGLPRPQVPRHPAHRRQGRRRGDAPRRAHVRRARLGQPRDDARDASPRWRKVCRTRAAARGRSCSRSPCSPASTHDDLQRVGVRSGVESQVVRLARLAQRGRHGRRRRLAAGDRAHPQACGRGFLIVTPGVRPPCAAVDDQKRVMTPDAAIRAGADYLVVGRPIRDAADPVAAAQEVVADMARGLLVSRGRLAGR